jgi:hypothetical protein
LEQASLRQPPVGSAPPTATLAQVPSWPGSAQDRQSWLQDEAQQRPWAQMSLPHWSFWLHSEPVTRLPQSPATQSVPATHWPSVAQLLRH